MAGNEPKVILGVEGLTKHDGGVHALEQADFVLHDGEHVAVVDHNGAGKSTFVRQITGVERPTSGNAIISLITGVKTGVHENASYI